MMERPHVFKHLRRRDPRRPSLRGRRPRRSAMANERHGDRGGMYLWFTFGGEVKYQ